ncbi:hypothetical protein WN944_014948 [Citrus x changshan-huyou]|uniref:Uncharacterized protein n=1 Tax=Citrus x changshan-huyou TaxID=2935761 RepID=A0AAP0MD16_9ROSI
MNEAARIGSLTIACRNLIHFAAKMVDGYNNAIQVIHGLTLRAQDVLDIDDIPRASTKGRLVDIIKDPLIIKTKGSAKTTKAFVKKRLCGTCQQPGHTKRTCIQYGGVKGNRDIDNASLCTDFVSENTFNTTIATTTANLDMSTWGVMDKALTVLPFPHRTYHKTIEVAPYHPSGMSGGIIMLVKFNTTWDTMQQCN